MIQSMYLVEKESNSASGEKRLALRQSMTVRMLENLKKWLDRQKVIALPKSPLGKGVTYALNNWDALNTFATRGDLNIDNNKSENALGAMAIGRKNWKPRRRANGDNHCQLPRYLQSARHPSP